MRLSAAIILLGAAVALEAGPLSPRALEQVQSARDYSATVDTAALYPLLEDAANRVEADETGASVPDYRAVAADPHSHRARQFLVEGRLLRSAPVRKLARPGPWDDGLTQWVIQHGSHEDDTAVVYLLAPPAEARPGAQVRLPARFYMIWRTTLHNSTEQADFLIFVGNSARVVRADADGTALVPVGLLLVMLLAMGIGFMVLRGRVKQKTITPRRLHSATPGTTQPDKNRHNVSEPPEPDAPLPTDPADALDALRRRHEE